MNRFCRAGSGGAREFEEHGVVANVQRGEFKALGEGGRGDQVAPRPVTEPLHAAAPWSDRCHQPNWQASTASSNNSEPSLPHSRQGEPLSLTHSASKTHHGDDCEDLVSYDPISLEVKLSEHRLKSGNGRGRPYGTVHLRTVSAIVES